MQSSGDGTSVLSLAHQQSDDSSSRTDAFSLISMHPDFSENGYIDLNATLNMAVPSGNDQPASENVPPVRPTTFDWVQEQSLHDQLSSGATRLQASRVDATPPRDSETKQIRAKTDYPASTRDACQPAKKVYDIPTLLRLKETQSAVPVMLKVKPEAIAENIFQYMGAATSRRLPSRSRGLSDISNISTGNPDPHSHTIYPTVRAKYMTQPLRQPRAPPETSILQRHDGFARFLKQHASPPHHRVTAGGRIVPAGPSSPPPMLDFGSLNGLLRDRPATAKSFQKDSTQSTTRVQNPQATLSMTLGDYLRSQGGSNDSMSFQHTAQPSPIQTATPFNNLPFGYHPFMAAMQTQAPMVPLAMFPDGSTLVSYNGMNYRASWNGASMNVEPFQPLQSSLDQQYYPQPHPQGHLNSSQYGVFPQPSQAANPSVPLASATNVSRPDSFRADLPIQHEAQNGDAPSLKAKLADLDKHLALYHYDITPADRVSLIAQRRCLVEEIDRIRLSKEKPKHSIPIVAPTAPGPSSTPAAPNGLCAKGRAVNKHLSPAAPAFVPRNASNFPSNSFSIRTASQQSKNERLSIRAPSGGMDSGPKGKDNANSSTWTSQSDNKAWASNTQPTSHSEESSSSHVLDPSDPAMRVIEYEDIEYAARYLYNWTKDTKTYCTTVAEFQEAVRRVREQARLYGCAGGQSKDPAYDAEQDLWWAICDRDPIPLPAKVADHVINPRPWNWNDSAFNYRRQGANDAPGPGCEQARNSPRVLGWDPATTDQMKDDIDVSRSYFALKGRLPSVSFRDFAYDRDGNKRLIQSDTAASAAYAADPRKMTYLGQSQMTSSRQNNIGSKSSLSAPKEMSTNDLNIQREHSALDARVNHGDKAKAPEVFSRAPGVPRTPEHRRIQQPFDTSNIQFITRVSTPNLSTGHKITNARTAANPHHAHIEDNPETPVTGCGRSTSKGVMTPLINNTSSTVRMDPLLISNHNARIGLPLQANVLDYTGPPTSTRRPTEEELNNIWYHTPLDEVTQKFIDDMKAYNPFKNKQADENNHVVISAKDHRQSSDTSNPVAESKSPWGPEEGATATGPSDRSRFDSLLTHASAEEQPLTQTAKVNIPSASTLRAPAPRVNANNETSVGSNNIKTLDSRELNAVNIPTAGGNESHHFLRKMLKSPRYASTQPMSVLSQISSTLADKLNGTKRAQVKPTEQQVENKGNTPSYNHGNTGIIDSGPSANSRPSSSMSLNRMTPNWAVSKAQSSLASSTYQAHGYLPQFDGAGKAHTSSVYREQGIHPLPQVRLPSEALYADRKHAAEASCNQIHGSSAYTTSTTYLNPVNFGYDGGRDSPPPKKTSNVPDDQHPDLPAFDLMGVTLADYENQRGDTNNAWHHGAVDDFFQGLREQELKIVASHQRVNTQSAA